MDLHKNQNVKIKMALGLFPHALGSASEDFFYTRISFDTFDTWGASPFLFFPTFVNLHSARV